MARGRISSAYDEARFREEAKRLLELVADARTVDEARSRLSAHVSAEQFEAHQQVSTAHGSTLHVVRDCARALRGMLHRRAEVRSGFGVAQALWDLAIHRSRTDLTPAFFAEMTQLVLGLEGRFEGFPRRDEGLEPRAGQAAALCRSDELDALWTQVEAWMSRYPDGLEMAVIGRRALRRDRILRNLGGQVEDFERWAWQVAHVARDAADVAALVDLSETERSAIERARGARLPFGITPYYASLMDDEPTSGRDRALRAQVIPPMDYVDQMASHRGDRTCAFDFMLERDTSPVPLVTRRYPAIAIFKPFNACPQICVYCQRNWEIDEAMAAGSLASPEAIQRAIAFLASHPAIREVLVTGGDPLALPDETILPILTEVARLPHVDVLRIGSRTLVTMPMRITQALAAAIGGLRSPGRREVEVITHVEHPYEITPELVTAVDRLRQSGIPVYNQLVYTFFVSRRFEAAKLRMVLKRVGIDPYYTFAPKGKTETSAYRVPLARILQEQKEEARLLPGSRRTDEAVYNVPGLGKNYLRAFQHRDIISVLPDGSRVYDFHPWEKNLLARDSYVGTDVPVLEYLQRLEDIGENPDDYMSIWYYF